LNDRDHIARYYHEEASLLVAREADTAILRAASQICKASESFRTGVRKGTREYVMRRFPYTLIYRVSGETVTIVRVMHQAAKYFN
jgi:toxin ParE1/3/4